MKFRIRFSPCVTKNILPVSLAVSDMCIVAPPVRHGPKRDPYEVAFEILLSEFSPVKQASLIERIELAWAQNEMPDPSPIPMLPAPPCEVIPPQQQ